MAVGAAEGAIAPVLHLVDERSGWPSAGLDGSVVPVQRALPAGSVVPAGPADHGVAPRTLPVPESLAGLFPWQGLRLGSVVAVQGSTSLLFALLSTASAAGAWSAVVGRTDLGLLAAADTGVAVQRLALVPDPDTELAAVVGALLDGMDLVALAGAERLTPAQRRRLTGRARQRGAVLLPLGDWPGADVRLQCDRVEWTGPGDGHGRLRSMRATVRAAGRGAAARPRTAVVCLSGRPPARDVRWVLPAGSARVDERIEVAG